MRQWQVASGQWLVKAEGSRDPSHSKQVLKAFGWGWRVVPGGGQCRAVDRREWAVGESSRLRRHRRWGPRQSDSAAFFLCCAVVLSAVPQSHDGRCASGSL
jgi:hypothetical protein